MLLVGTVCFISLFISIYQTEEHELYLPNNNVSSKFKRMNVNGIQECIEVCNKDRKCGVLATSELSGHVQCFIEDHTGNVTLTSTPDYTIMVKSSERRCKERCPSNFITLGLTGGCYYPVLDETLSWKKAEAACQELDQRAHLISVDSREEAASLTEFLAAFRVNTIWTGGQDLDQDGMFTWIGSQNALDADMWAQGAQLEGRCLYFYQYTTVLRGYECGARFKYVCEIHVEE